MKRPNDTFTILALFARVAGARLALGALLSTLVVWAGMALLGTSGWFISATALAGLAGATFMFNVFVPSAAIRLLALGRTFGRYAERMVTHDATFAVLATLREQLFRGWAAPDAARTLLRRPARLLFRLTHDIDALESIYLRLLAPACAALGAALLAGVLLGAIDLRLGVAMFAWLVLCGGGIAVIVARRARVLALHRVRALERLRAASIDLVAGQTDLLMAGRLTAQCAQLGALDGRLAQVDDALHQLEVRAGWGWAAGSHATVACVLLAVGMLAERKLIGAPLAALALLTALTALEPFAALRRGAIEAGRSALAARRVAPRLRQNSPATPGPSLPDADTALRLLDASVVHAGRDGAALHAVMLRIGSGERVAIIGASGAGKSTLLALAAGELAPASGQVQAQACTWLTQHTELFQDSVRDNLRLAAPAASDAQLWDALHAAGLEHDILQFGRGLDTMLGEGGLGLSGGQARRLALARLLLKQSPFWLLDEPTEALDSATAADVLARLAQHAHGRTVLLATHLRREAALADRLLMLKDGRIAADLQRGTFAFNAALLALRHD
ncbi:amino acid ABC transporter ATP-binding/permease protein [Massilia sp. S19_KUP03_FR1]|uniref:amino acid ABC transporter ATP-binding/permease protein n=1 Tax=Massilia sp. S19_KUP03_FR1 TaxID=3025503 RepID=UPI002FCD92A3